MINSIKHNLIKKTKHKNKTPGMLVNLNKKNEIFFLNQN